MNMQATEGVLNPPADRLVKAIKQMLARVSYHKGTITLLGDGAIKDHTELFDALSAMTGQDPTSLFHDIGALAQDLACDPTEAANTETSLDRALTANVDRQMAALEREMASAPKYSLVSIADIQQIR